MMPYVQGTTTGKMPAPVETFEKWFCEGRCNSNTKV